MFSHPAFAAPAVVVHGLDHARLALAPGRPVVLLSAPGAALYAGCLWWRALAAAARAEAPRLIAADILDCADAPGQAMAALRAGCPVVVLAPCPASARVAAAARALGALVLAAPPPALDLGRHGALHALPAWLARLPES